MAIVLSVLKVIGMILLVILALILILLAVLLFLPVRYQLYGESEPAWYGKVSIGGFSGFFRFVGEYKDESFGMKLTALWGLLHLYPPKDKRPKRDKTKRNNDLTSPDSQSLSESTMEDSQTEEPQISLDGETVSQKTVKETVENKHIFKKYKKDASKIKSRKSKKKTNEFRDLRESINKKENQRAISYIIGKALWLVKKVKPTIAMADIDYSLGDPALTGQLTGILSMCPSVYGKHKRITPDFVSEDIYIKGKIKLTGRIYMVHIVKVGLQVLRNKDCKQLFGR